MDRGIYASASAGLFQFRKLEVVNNNLANINTPGFKKQMLAGEVQTFDQTLASTVGDQDPYARGDHERTPGVINTRTITDFTQGAIKNTGSPLDVALRNPRDFFVVAAPGGLQYTRAGNFTLNSNGEIVTADGMPLQGDGGPIAVTGAGVQISSDGSVLANGNRIGRLSVVRFDNPSSLDRVGETRFNLGAGQPPPVEVEPEIEPQALEMSNVSAITSMVDLITTQRAFQAYTKSSETVDQLNQIAINQVGRAR